MKELAQVGIFGGSGFYNFVSGIEEYEIETPYGATSDKIMLAEIEGKKVAFMPRHGRNHHITPNKINYRANVWAMKEIGCKRVISPCAAGSLQKHVKPGDIVFCDQFFDKTSGRKDSFFDEDDVIHVSAADIYCPQFREVAIKSAQNLGLSFHKKGTVVVIPGPRFSSKAESEFYTKQGWEVINMTQYPEAYLVKEMDMCPLNITLVTDYDAGLVAGCAPVSHGDVLKVFQSNLENLRRLLFEIIKNLPDTQECGCFDTIKNSRF